MMRAIRAFIYCTLVFMLSMAWSVSRAQSSSINVISTAVPFLRISPDARAGGMGDAGIATEPDANSSFWNLAKTPFATRKHAIAATYTPWLGDITKDVYMASLAGYHQLDNDQALSMSVRYFNLGDIQFTDYNGNALGSSKPREFSIDFGYSRKLSDEFGIGVALRYINSRLASGDVNNSGTVYKPGNAIAGDISFYYNGKNQDGQGLSAGLVLSNLGSKISYTDNVLARDYIPANLGFGLCYTAVVGEGSKLSFAADVNKLLVPPLPVYTGSGSADSASLAAYHNYGVFESWFKSFGSGGGLDALQYSVGAEYNYADIFMARAGYFFEDQSKGGRKYFTLGVGLNYNQFGLNFSYLVPSGDGTTRNPLSNTLRFGVVFNWAK